MLKPKTLFSEICGMGGGEMDPNQKGRLVENISFLRILYIKYVSNQYDNAQM